MVQAFLVALPSSTQMLLLPISLTPAKLRTSWTALELADLPRLKLKVPQRSVKCPDREGTNRVRPTRNEPRETADTPVGASHQQAKKLDSERVG